MKAALALVLVLTLAACGSSAAMPKRTGAHLLPDRAGKPVTDHLTVTSQRNRPPRGSAPTPSSLATPPCARPRGGWRLVAPTEAQRGTIGNSRPLVNQVRSRLIRFFRLRPLERYGWINGAGGDGVSSRGQPTVSLDVLIETPGLRALLRHMPPGLVVVQPTFERVRSYA